MNRTEQKAARAAADRDAKFLGVVLQEWSNMEGDFGEAGKRVVSAIRQISFATTRLSSEEAFVQDTNNAAEWLRLAALVMDKAVDWPANGR